MLNIVLVEPEIPQNTGSIGRLALAIGARLHLVEPLGFDLSEKQLRRAGLDYWEHVDLIRYKSLEEFVESMPSNTPKLLLTKKAGRTLFDVEIRDGSYLIFGKETAGLPDWFLNKFTADCVRIPMKDARVRSLNLANAVSIVAYEGVRQLGLALE